MTAPASDRFEVFGTTAVLVVTEPDALPAARARADAELAAIDRAASRFRADSELSLLNSRPGELVPVSELLADLLAEALRAADVTDGDVDPTCGTALNAAGYDRDFGQLRAGRVTLTVAAGPVPGWARVRLDRDRRTVRLDHGVQLDLGS
ncbi:MAG TPA: FAD:protein FMN transferase, partial [Streptosporangiaceae bacterium]